VSVIDGETNRVKATVPTGRGPWALAVAPAADRVYVANRLSEEVTVIDGRTNRASHR
jgi:DNA-binding beta-propeller fold protein YncE